MPHFICVCKYSRSYSLILVFILKCLGLRKYAYIVKAGLAEGTKGQNGADRNKR